jgi:hypothetical protein
MLDDLFSHKIHASEDLEAWERRLVRLASIFHQFDGMAFDREGFDSALAILAPEAARSPFRDQYSIYISILGVGQIVRSGEAWICRLSETARAFLVGVEPDVAAFCRLQLALYQRPDGRGQTYRGNGHVEHGSATKTLELIGDGYHVCPLRLILRIFEAKALEGGISEDEVQVLPEEIYALANRAGIRDDPAPDIGRLRRALRDFSRGRLNPPEIKRKTFAFLESTGLLSVDSKGRLSLMKYPTQELRDIRDRQIRAIRRLTNFYRELDLATDADDLATILAQGDWAEYFDAVRQLPLKAVNVIAGRDYDAAAVQAGAAAAPEAQPAPVQAGAAAAPEPQPAPVQAGAAVAPEPQPAHPAPVEFGATGRLRRPLRVAEAAADPEETRILRERRNAYHDLILRKIADKIRSLELLPEYTDYIDLFTNVDNVAQRLGERFSIAESYLDGQILPYFPNRERHGITFLFEAKSSDDRIVLAQVRKAVGQLYEYRYRYGETLRPHVVLIVALQNDIRNFPWLRDYLLRDRHIAVCWLDANMERLLCPRECHSVLGAFVDAVA